MHLAVLLDERISDWAAKGEILSGYFNPAGAFERVSVIVLPHDSPTLATVERLAAPAPATFVAMGVDRRVLAAKTLGLLDALLARELRPLVEQVRGLRPDLVRAYGDGLAAAAAGIVSAATGVPYVVSLHATPDESRERNASWRERVWRRLLAGSVARGLAGARALLAVYSPIIEGLPAPLRARATVVPNVVACAPRRERRDARSDRPLEVLWVGRMIAGRDPAPLIDALAQVSNARLTMIGDGPLAESVRVRARASGAGKRIRFVAALDNARLIAGLGNFDVLALRTDYAEVAKPVMEAALAGLPVVINRTPSQSLAEYDNFPAIFVDAIGESYAAALGRLADDAEWRYEIAGRTLAAALERWDPASVAARTAALMRAAITG